MLWGHHEYLWRGHKSQWNMLVILSKEQHSMLKIIVFVFPETLCKDCLEKQQSFLLTHANSQINS